MKKMDRYIRIEISYKIEIFYLIKSTFILNMGRKSGNNCGKLAKYEQPRKKKKNNKKKDFDMNGKYNKKSVRKLESFLESQAPKIPQEKKENEAKKGGKSKKSGNQKNKK